MKKFILSLLVLGSYVSAFSENNNCDKPIVNDIDLCLNDSADIMSAVKTTGPDYELLWFTGPTETEGTITNPVINTSTPGIFEFYVAQRTLTEPYLQSDIVSFQARVNNVSKPKVNHAVRYMKNEAAKTKEFVDILIKSSDAIEIVPGQTLLWALEKDGDYTKGSSASSKPFYDTTAVAGETEYQTRWARWSKVTESGTECLSEASKIDITISSASAPKIPDLTVCLNESFNLKTAVKAAPGYELLWFTNADASEYDALTSAPKVPTEEEGTYKYYVAQRSITSPFPLSEIDSFNVEVIKVNEPMGSGVIQYAPNDGANGFLSVLKQNPSAVVADSNCVLNWYDSEKTPLSTEPTPTYDPTLPGNIRYTYFVSQSKLGCESEMKEISVVIGSDIPEPLVQSFSTCEGSSRLSGSINQFVEMQTMDADSSKYELVWFTENPLKNPNAIEHTDIILDTMNFACDSDSINEKDFSFYVYQREVATGATSPVQTLTITIYSKPRVVTSVPEPVCAGEVVNLSEYIVITNTLANNKYEVNYLDETGNNANNVVSKTGNYSVVASFHTNPMFPETDEICSSDEAVIPVSVIDLNVEIYGQSTTCPGEDVNLQAYVYVDDRLIEDVTYNWTSVLHQATGSSSKFVIPSFVLENPGDMDIVTLDVTSSNGCSSSVKHSITVGLGLIKGFLTWTESDNEISGEIINLPSPNKEGIQISACGNTVNVDCSDIDKESVVEWFTTPDHTGLPVKVGDKVSFTKEEYGKYYLHYVNKCETYLSLEIINSGIEIKTIPDGDVTLCEGGTYSKEIELSCAKEETMTHWYVDGGMFINVDDKLYFPSLKHIDSGKYTVEYLYKNCKASFDIVNLKVRPYTKFNISGYDLADGKNVYIVKPGENVDVMVEFKEPFEPSQIASLTAIYTDDSESKATVSSDNKKLSFTNVRESHHVNLTFESNDYCPSSIDFYVGNGNDDVFDIASESLEIYPTPAKDELFVSGMEDGDVCVISDMTGKAVLKATSSPINIKHLQKGIYAVSMNGRKAKIVKE
ncbi:MAG: T9SS type A sorting domain-containing protein [Paludibacteraceae bacterium]|nr:T9SS type A sorting domain-containing protein [Paludibacteraceae bacterium]